MTSSEYRKLSVDLRSLAKLIPLNWGRIQNNRYDANINMFAIETFGQIEDEIAGLSESLKNYFRRRWYLWRCSQCDEYLFAINQNVEPNPNQFDQSYDIIFNGSVRFDVKGTVIPKSFRGDIDNVIRDPQKMVDFFYEEQSKGVRHSFQNRLFIVHHSFVDPAREFFLRCAWGSKEAIYRIFSENFSNIRLLESHGCKAAVIFILEREQNKVSYVINGLSL